MGIKTFSRLPQPTHCLLTAYSDLLQPLLRSPPAKNNAKCLRMYSPSAVTNTHRSCDAGMCDDVSHASVSQALHERFTRLRGFTGTSRITFSFVLSLHQADLSLRQPPSSSCPPCLTIVSNSQPTSFSHSIRTSQKSHKDIIRGPANPPSTKCSPAPPLQLEVVPLPPTLFAKQASWIVILACEISQTNQAVAKANPKSSTRPAHHIDLAPWTPLWAKTNRPLPVEILW